MSMKVRLKGIAKVGAGLLVYLTAPVLGTIGIVKFSKGMIEVNRLKEEYNQSEERKEDILETNQKIFEFEQMKEQNLISQNEYQEYLDYYNSDEYYALQLNESSFGEKVADATKTTDEGVLYFLIPGTAVFIPSALLLYFKSNNTETVHFRVGGGKYSDERFSLLDNGMMEYIIDGTYEFIMGKKYESKTEINHEYENQWEA